MTPKEIALNNLEVLVGEHFQTDISKLSKAYLDLEKQLAAAKEVVEAARKLRCRAIFSISGAYEFFKVLDWYERQARDVATGTTSEGSGE